MDIDDLCARCGVWCPDGMCQDCEEDLRDAGQLDERGQECTLQTSIDRAA